MKPFVLNRHGKLIFPSNIFPELDFSVVTSQDQLDRVVRRDFETKAPTGTEMLRRIETRDYADRSAGTPSCEWIRRSSPPAPSPRARTR